MRISLVAAEAVPFVKVGGLGDVVGSLGQALVALGHEVTVILPWYGGIDATPAGSHSFEVAGKHEEASLGEARVGKLRYLFVGSTGVRGQSPYGGDEVPRFLRFALAAAGLCDADVVHAHDWQAALLPVLGHAGRFAAKTVLTIHNLAYQGRTPAPAFFELTGLDDSYFDLEALEYYGDANPLKGGIVYADRVTTVSPTYAREVQTQAYGAGLDGVLRKHAVKLVGILNGIDSVDWNPSTDQALVAPYDAPSGKAKSRAALARELGLSGPILGFIGRLVEQKGADLLRAALPEIIGLGYSVALLGTGDPREQAKWVEASQANPGRVFATIGFDDALARRIYAGSDAIVVPSRFEPCGLVQLIAQRYGTPPIARKTGGLVDTIAHGVDGIHFEAASVDGVVAGVTRFHLHPQKEAMASAGMAKDLSWDRAARAYQSLYAEVVRG